MATDDNRTPSWLPDVNRTLLWLWMTTGLPLMVSPDVIRNHDGVRFMVTHDNLTPSMEYG